MVMYDHTRDPLEWTNLARHPEYTYVKARLKAYPPKTNEPESPRN